MDSVLDTISIPVHFIEITRTDSCLVRLFTLLNVYFVSLNVRSALADPLHQSQSLFGATSRAF